MNNPIVRNIILTMASVEIVPLIGDNFTRGIKNNAIINVQEIMIDPVQMDVIFEDELSQEDVTDGNIDKTINIILILVYFGFLLLAIIFSIVSMKLKERKEKEKEKPPSYNQIFFKEAPPKYHEIQNLKDDIEQPPINDTIFNDTECAQKNFLCEK